MKTRSVKQHVISQRVNMGGIMLDQPLPHRGLDMIDPFVLVHHWDDMLPGGQDPRNLGVGPHPHRGFTPVTFIFNGAVRHQDSTGVVSVIEKGGTQWMNAGKGIVHSERPPKSFAEEGGRFEIIQFWVNAPAKHKMDEPSYQPLTAEETPTVVSADGKVKAGVVVGETLGVKGRLRPNSDILGVRLESQKGGKMNLPIPKNFNAFIYILDGGLMINNTEYGAKSLINFDLDGEGIAFEALDETRAIMLSGEPINEPVVTYGPFVMNSQREIIDAMQDFQNGKMGRLVETFD